ncbi:MAG: hypothetical protein NTV29_15895 [Planctomycetota bacterium]|nr:hypothetical protein [Planctomycetota bacterium]
MIQRGSTDSRPNYSYDCRNCSKILTATNLLIHLQDHQNRPMIDVKHDARSYYNRSSGLSTPLAALRETWV